VELAVFVVFGIVFDLVFGGLFVFSQHLVKVHTRRPTVVVLRPEWQEQGREELNRNVTNVALLVEILQKLGNFLGRVR